MNTCVYTFAYMQSIIVNKHKNKKQEALNLKNSWGGGRYVQGFSRRKQKVELSQNYNLKK